MPGPQELTIIALLALGLFLLRRWMLQGGGGEPKVEPAHTPVRAFPAWKRLAIVASILFPVAAALLLEPWDGALRPWLRVGVLPVIAGWGIGWVLLGYRGERLPPQ